MSKETAIIAKGAILMNATAMPIVTKKGDDGYMVNGTIIVDKKPIDVSFFARPSVVESMNKKVCLVNYDSSAQYTASFGGFKVDTLTSYNSL